MFRLLVFNLLIVLIISCKDNSIKESKSNLKKKTEIVDSNILNVRNYFLSCNHLLIAFPLTKIKFIVADSLFKDSINIFYPFIQDSIKYDSCKLYSTSGTLLLKDNKDSIINSIDFSLNCQSIIIQTKYGLKYYLMDKKFQNYLSKMYKSVEDVIRNFHEDIDY
jgi:hypothetical protein